MSGAGGGLGFGEARRLDARDRRAVALVDQVGVRAGRLDPPLTAAAVEREALEHETDERRSASEARR